jgi:hypothetical protein
LKSSFCIGSFWIVTFGCVASKAFIAFAQTVLSTPVVALFCQVRVTGAALALALVLALGVELAEGLELELLPLLLLLQAAIVTAAATAIAMAAGFREARMALIS